MNWKQVTVLCIAMVLITVGITIRVMMPPQTVIIPLDVVFEPGKRCIILTYTAYRDVVATAVPCEED